MSLAWEIIKILSAGFFLLFIISIGMVVFRSNKSMLDKQVNARVLQYSQFYRWLSIAMIIGSIVFVRYIYIIETPEDIYGWMLIFFMIIFFTVCTLYLVLETYTTKIFFSDSGILFKSIWKKINMTWAEIAEVNYTAEKSSIQTSLLF